MRPATQTDRVLRVLQQRGERGVSAVDFLLPHVVDGGPPILRLPSRVDDLRRRGHRISSSMKKVGGARLAVYVLADACDPGSRSDEGLLDPRSQKSPGEPLALDVGGTAADRPPNPYEAEVQ